MNPGEQKLFPGSFLTMIKSEHIAKKYAEKSRYGRKTMPN